MISKSDSWTGPDDVERVLLSTTEDEAFAQASHERRRLPRGGGWVVRTLKRYVRAERITISVWVVVVTKESKHPSALQHLASASGVDSVDAEGPSHCSTEDPSGDLQ